MDRFTWESFSTITHGYPWCLGLVDNPRVKGDVGGSIGDSCIWCQTLWFRLLTHALAFSPEDLDLVDCTCALIYDVVIREMDYIQSRTFPETRLPMYKAGLEQIYCPLYCPVVPSLGATLMNIVGTTDGVTNRMNES